MTDINPKLEDLLSELKYLSYTPECPVSFRACTACTNIESDFNYKKMKYYLAIRIPKFIAKLIGEDKVFTEYVDCEVTNIEEL